MLLIGQAVHLDDQFLHQLKLAALLHAISRLMPPPHLQARQGSFEPDAYLAIQNHAGFGATLLQPFSRWLEQKIR